MSLVLAAAEDVGSVAAFRANVRRVRERSGAVSAELLRMLDETRARLRDRALRGTEADQAWVRMMLREVEAEVRDLAQRMEPAMREHFLSVIRQGDEDTLNVARSDAPPGVWLGPAGADADLIDFASQDSADLVRQVSTLTLGRLNRTFRAAAASGLKVEEVARQIGSALAEEGRPVGIFGPVATQVERAMRTESGRIYEGASAARAWRVQDDSGMVAEKGWIATLDGRERDSHRALNGTWIPMAAKFTVGGYEADGPLDPALPAAEAVNCRCALGYRFKEAA